MSAQTEETSSDDSSTDRQAVTPDSALPRALVAWLVVAVLTVIFATIATVEASATPVVDGASLSDGCSRAFGLFTIAVFGVAAIGVSAHMWRDLPRHTSQMRRARRYG